ncbi:MAG TPA: hypothetical protein VG034_12150 [Acidimicrobiia bacterium]|nr:hypothetical protein [Acidimicrobiia bacterium]
MRTLWPPTEAAQIDYEALRTAVLDGQAVDERVAARFARAGLAGLIAAPVADTLMVVRVVGARRPAWSPHDDPREAALAEGFELVLAATGIETGRALA